MNKYKKIRAMRKRNDGILRPLRALHPNTFSHWGNPCNPLKVGIFKDLRDKYPTLSKKRLHEFLWAYSRSHRYLAAIALRIPRIDLDGSQICLITDRDVEYAHEIGRRKFANWDDILAVEARYRNDLFSQAAE